MMHESSRYNSSFKSHQDSREDVDVGTKSRNWRSTSPSLASLCGLLLCYADVYETYLPSTQMILQLKGTLSGVSGDQSAESWGAGLDLHRAAGRDGLRCDRNKGWMMSVCEAAVCFSLFLWGTMLFSHSSFLSCLQSHHGVMATGPRLWKNSPPLTVHAWQIDFHWNYSLTILALVLAIVENKQVFAFGSIEVNIADKKV